MTKIFVKSLTVESGTADGKTVGGISVFDGKQLLSFAFSAGFVATLRDIVAVHFSKHLSKLPIDEAREREFSALRADTAVKIDQDILFASSFKVIANEERTEIHVGTVVGSYILHLDNVCVIHLKKEFEEKFYDVAPKDGSLQ